MPEAGAFDAGIPDAGDAGDETRAGDASAGPDADADAGDDGACPGSLVGTWNLVSRCPISSMSPSDTCDGGYESNSGTETGVAVFRADGTYSLSIQHTGTEIAVAPLWCFDAGIFSFPCNDQGVVDLSGGFDGATGTCVAASQTCTCTIRSTWSEATAGTYTMSGGSLTLTTLEGGTPPGGPAPADYCVQGDTLWLYVPSRNLSCTDSDQFEGQRQ
jgi:hypothetical protein